MPENDIDPPVVFLEPAPAAGRGDVVAGREDEVVFAFGDFPSGTHPASVGGVSVHVARRHRAGGPVGDIDVEALPAAGVAAVDEVGEVEDALGGFFERFGVTEGKVFGGPAIAFAGREEVFERLLEGGLGEFAAGVEDRKPEAEAEGEEAEAEEEFFHWGCGLG